MNKDFSFTFDILNKETNEKKAVLSFTSIQENEQNEEIKKEPVDKSKDKILLTLKIPTCTKTNKKINRCEKCDNKNIKGKNYCIFHIPY